MTEKRGGLSQTLLVGGAIFVLVVVILALLGPEQASYDSEGRRISEIAETAAPTTSERFGSAYHAPQPTNIRSGPGEDNEIVGRLATDEVAFIGSRDSDGWVAVYQGGDTSGFVLARLLRPGYPGSERENPTTNRTRSTTQKISLRVSAFNMADSPVRGKAEVWLRGQGSWFPDLRYGGDVTTFEGRRLGTIDSLYFYPLGRGGPELMVPIQIDSELCPQGCVRDMVNFEIYADRFLAWGSPIEGHEVALKR